METQGLLRAAAARRARQIINNIGDGLTMTKHALRCFPFSPCQHAGTGPGHYSNAAAKGELQGVPAGRGGQALVPSGALVRMPRRILRIERVQRPPLTALGAPK